MSAEKQIQSILKSKGLRTTAIRKEVVAFFLSEEKALSKADIEERLGDVDRITLYRTIKSFEDVGIIHEAIDGTSETKYALCPDQCSSHEHQHQHAHFHCRDCGNTYCIDEIEKQFIPQTSYKVESVEVVLKGVCEKCE